MADRILELVAVSPYNVEILPELEKFVEEQVTQATYSLEANLALLRLYQFEPQKAKVGVLTRILIKGLMALPALDFSLYINLIPEKMQQDEPFATLITLANLLEGAQFKEFWSAADRSHALLDTVQGFDDAIRGFVIHVLSISFQKVPRPVLTEALNLSGAELESFLEEKSTKLGWVLSSPDLIELPKNEDNHPELRRNVADNISFDVVSKIFPILS